MQRLILEGERADEQAHREADAAEQRHAVAACASSRRAAARASPRRIAHARREHDADLLADEQPARDAEGDRVGKVAERMPANDDAGVGEGEQRHDAEGDPGLAARARAGRSGAASSAALALRSGMDSASTTPASVACTPDLSTQTQSTSADQNVGRDAARRRRGSAPSSADDAARAASASDGSRQVARCRTAR